MKVRELEIAVVSDLHLATHACKPKKILKYLKSIQPKTLVLNGDIIDSWRFSRNYFPKLHLKVIRQLIKMMEKGVLVYYITGNHDEFLRKFAPTQIGNLKIVNQLILNLGDKKTWIFHGDAFDNVIHQTKWLAKFGAASYGLLTLLNKGINNLLSLFGKDEIVIYTSIKRRLVKDKLNLSKFERAIGNAAAAQGYETVICGHSHFPKQKELLINGKSIRYLNCGDWVGNFSAAEYYDNNWHVYFHEERDEEAVADEPDFMEEKQIYQTLIRELTFASML